MSYIGSLALYVKDVTCRECLTNLHYLAKSFELDLSAYGLDYDSIDKKAKSAEEKERAASYAQFEKELLG